MWVNLHFVADYIRRHGLDTWDKMHQDDTLMAMLLLSGYNGLVGALALRRFDKNNPFAEDEFEKLWHEIRDGIGDRVELSKVELRAVSEFLWNKYKGYLPESIAVNLDASTIIINYKQGDKQVSVFEYWDLYHSYDNFIAMAEVLEKRI